VERPKFWSKNHYFGGQISFSWVEVKKLLFSIYPNLLHNMINIQQFSLLLLPVIPSENQHKAARGTLRLIEAWHAPQSLSKK
jgi:hypothetical protein